jgi:hypothetical protein
VPGYFLTKVFCLGGQFAARLLFTSDGSSGLASQTVIAPVVPQALWLLVSPILYAFGTSLDGESMVKQSGRLDYKPRCCPLNAG